MPELPEVQTIVNDLRANGLVGQKIIRAQVFWPATIATSLPDTFRDRIEGRSILSIGRRGKLILFQLDGGWLLGVHLRMTGRFELVKADGRRDKHVHVVLALTDKRLLWFRDTRKFGRFYLVDDPRLILGSIGPEPLAPQFSAAKLARLLAGRHRLIKPLLLDQTVIAGLGNIYVDEALWTARIHPLRKADTLLPREVKMLHAAIRCVLRQGLKNAGTTLGGGKGNFYSLDSARGRNADHLKVFRRTGQPCRSCHTPIRRIVVGQRSTHICQTCQPFFQDTRPGARRATQTKTKG